MKILVLIGPPGSGKSFYAHWLTTDYHFAHLASGDICRLNEDFIDPVSQQTVAQIVKSGQLVHPDLIGKLVTREIDKLLKKNTPIVLDGFPRNLTQYYYFLNLIKQKQWQVIFFILKCSPLIAQKRIGNRLICSQCGLVYNILTKPPLQPGYCDRDKAKLIQRFDDSKFKERMTVFQKETEPMIHAIVQQDILPKYVFVPSVSSTNIKQEIIIILQKHQLWV